MVLVDISVPVFFRDYDFKLREDVPVREIVRQICRILAEKEDCPMDETDHEFVLCSVSEKKILNMDWTLNRLNIRSGNRLLLI
ncbi:MAG: EsaB/YukD family protein [bacterium]|nr:EsaB/YukD family protein [bacterium]